MIKCNMIIELASDNLFSLVSAAREVAYNYNRKEFFLFELALAKLYQTETILVFGLNGIN